MKGLDKSLYYALRSVFDPLAFVLIKSGIGLRPVIEALKDSYVDQARKQDDVAERENKSAISRRIGITRREVSTIIDRLNDETPDFEAAVHIACSGIVGIWRTAQEYLATDGSPKRLTEEELSLICASIAPAIESELLIKTLLNNSTIRKRDDGVFVLVENTWVVSRSLSRLITNTLGTAASTLPVNWDRPYGEGFCQSVSFVPRPSEEFIPRVRQTARKRITRFIEEADDHLMSLDSSPSENADENNRKDFVGISAFYFEMKRDYSD